MRSRRATVALTIALGLTALAGCAAASDADPAVSGEATPGTELTGTLTLFAAASLTESFDALAERFEQRHPSVEVVLNYGGSSALAQQIVAGAPADVFAAANLSTMQTVVDADLASDPVVFATNALQLVVPAGNPAGVAGLDDLARPGLAIALCDPVVPCGAAAEQLLAAAGVIAEPDTLEEDVKAVLTKVLLGEADAGLVYVTDVRAAGDEVEGIVLAEADEALNPYPVAAITGAASPDLAAEWIALLTGPDGRSVLAEAGFGAP
jgi:molybdate transport system substrate-binding protein